MVLIERSAYELAYRQAVSLCPSLAGSSFKNFTTRQLVACSIDKQILRACTAGCYPGNQQ